MFVVDVTDGGFPALSDTVLVTIKVNDVNDNKPVVNPYSYSTEVSFSDNTGNTNRFST